VVGGWPAVSLVGSYELLVWLIRTSGPTARGPSAVHRSDAAVCHGAVHERGRSDPAWWPASPAAGQSPILDGGQRDDEVLEAGAVNDAAVSAYRLSAQAGNPLSERRLAQMFGRPSRPWARARIADARVAEQLSEGCEQAGMSHHRTRASAPLQNGSAFFLATLRDKLTFCNWLEQFQIADCSDVVIVPT